MSQDFIKQEAQKHTSIVNEVKNALLGSIHDTNQIGNLFGSTAGTIAGLMKIVPGSKMLLTLTTINGTMINYGVQMAKDGDHSYKHTFLHN